MKRDMIGALGPPAAVRGPEAAFRGPVHNYLGELPFLRDETTVPAKYGGNMELAREIIERGQLRKSGTPRHGLQRPGGYWFPATS